MEMRARTVRHRTGEGGPTDKVLLPIFRAQHVHKSQKSEQSVEDKDSDAQGQAVKHRQDSGVIIAIHTCLTLLRCWKTQTTLEQQKS